MIKLLADENIPNKSIDTLKNLNFDIVSIRDISPGMSDSKIIDLANKENRTIITFDSDFGELIFKSGKKPEFGVVFLRIKNYSPLEIGIIVESLLNKQGLNFENRITVLDENNIRQRIF